MALSRNTSTRRRPGRQTKKARTREKTLSLASLTSVFFLKAVSWRSDLGDLPATSDLLLGSSREGESRWNGERGKALGYRRDVW